MSEDSRPMTEPTEAMIEAGRQATWANKRKGYDPQSGIALKAIYLAMKAKDPDFMHRVSPDEDAVERAVKLLLVKEHKGRYEMGGGVVSTDGKPGASWGGGKIMEYRNPDGPTIAAMLRAALTPAKSDAIELPPPNAEQQAKLDQIFKDTNTFDPKAVIGATPAKSDGGV